MEQSGYWLVILGDDDDVGRVLGKEVGAPDEILGGAAQMSVEQWLAARGKLEEEEYGAQLAVMQAM